ncbi:MAG: peptidoglycan-binding domain-containing protein [Patescibacteria group bacterium]
MKSQIVLLLLLGSLIINFDITTAQTTGISTFDQNLYFGLRNNSDVSRLQSFLKQEGFYQGPVTGNFFSLTLAGVKKFQQTNNISPIFGYFGPTSRLIANKQLITDAISTAMKNLNAIIVPPSTQNNYIGQLTPVSMGQLSSTTLPSVVNNDSFSDIEIQQLQEAVIELKSKDFLNQLLEQQGPSDCKTINECQIFCAKSMNALVCENFFLTHANP